VYIIRVSDGTDGTKSTTTLKESLPALVCDLFTFSSKAIKMFIIVLKNIRM
jgi:hypothetical protein